MSGLPPKADIVGPARDGVRHRPPVRRSNRVLVEGHADLLTLAPDDVTGNARAVRLKDKVETLGNVVGVSNVERRPRNGNVTDQAINVAASELNHSRHQHKFARDRAPFHETMIRRYS